MYHKTDVQKIKHKKACTFLVEFLILYFAVSAYALFIAKIAIQHNRRKMNSAINRKDFSKKYAAYSMPLKFRTGKNI